MKKYLIALSLLWPALAFGQQTYTNADLVKFSVPGAYTNEDLRRLSPLPVQRQPAAALPPAVLPAVPTEKIQAHFDALRWQRDAYRDELGIELEAIAYSESAFAGGTTEIEPRLGYRARVRPLVEELQKRVALLEAQMERVRDEARRAGAVIDVR